MTTEQWYRAVNAYKQRVIQLIGAAHYSSLPPTQMSRALARAFHRLIITNRALKSAQIKPKLP